VVSVGTVAAARTVLDYSLCWKAYYMLLWLVLYLHFISTSEKEDASLPIHSLSGFDCESQPNSHGDGN
jgi:hypothetical protein